MFVYKVNVLEELKKIGINQTWLYHHPNCGVSQSAVSDLRKGKVIGIKTLDALCRLLRCQPGDLIAWKEPEE
jgi:DNA-binding Xre family transcriptional regulator